MAEYQRLQTRFIQLLEQVSEQRGFKALHGRILASLFLTSVPQTQQEIAQWTGYSISAISRALEQLVALGSVRRYRKPRSRSYHYEIGTSMTTLFVGAIERWLILVQQVQKPIAELVEAAQNVNVESLSTQQALEAHLLVEQLRQLDDTLRRVTPLFIDLRNRLQTLD